MTENKPVSSNLRTPIIDILRGWALFSVVIMNYVTIYGWNTHALESDSGNLTSYIESTCEIVLGSKGWTLLAVLFGFGFSVLLKHTRESGQSIYLFFIKRMLWLLVFGFVNTLFFGGDILTDYAIMGLLLLLFYNCSTRTLLITGITILVLTPLLQAYLGRHHLLFAPKDRDVFYQLYQRNTFWDHIQANLFNRYKWMLRLSYAVVLHLIQLGCFLTGMALHRSGFMEKQKTKQKAVKMVFGMALLLSAVIYSWQYIIEQYEWKFNEMYNLYYPQIICIMIATTTGIMLIYDSGKLKNLFAALQATGKMTLTNYITQNIISFFLLICLKPNWPLYAYLLIGLGVYILQLFFSRWWLKRYQYGLLEWLWRSLSYGRRFQLKK